MKTLFRVRGLSLALIIALVAACGGAETRLARHLAKGQEFLASDNFEKARVEFRNALQIDPNDAQARFLHGRALEKLGNLREAAGMYQAAIDSDTNHIAARANLGRMFVFAGAPERALEYIGPGLEKVPNDSHLLTVRAAARSQLKDVTGALEDGSKALAADPANENAVALLAALYRQTGEPNKAADLLRDALVRLPRSIELRQVLATLYLSLEEHALAEAQLKEIIAINPERLPARYQLAIFYAGQKRFDDADRTFREAIKVAPDSDEPLLQHADFVASWRGRDAGIETLASYVAKRPKDPELLLGLGALVQRSGDTERALSTYQRVVDAERSEAPGLVARNRMAAIQAARGNLSEANRLIAEVLRENPRDNEALLLRGSLALEKRDPAAAVADLRAVLRDQPQSVGIMRALARAHLANREPALAEENLRQAIQIAPGDVQARLELATLLGQTGRTDQAIPLLEDAVRSHPTDPAAREALVRAYVTARDLRAARVAINDLVTLAPDAPQGHYLSGLMSQTENKLEQAEASLVRALELSPQAADVLAALARVKVQRGKSTEAETLVRSVADKNPSNAPARNLLGELLMARKAPPAEQRAAFEQAIAAAPKWWLPYRNLAMSQLAEGATDAALATYSKGVTATAEVALSADLAALYERLGRPADAIKEYEAVLQRDPRSDIASNNLAMLLVTYRTDQASLDRAAQLTAGFQNSADAALLDTHGWVLVKRRQYAEALPALERAAKLAPQSPAVRFHLAMAQLGTGQRDQARDNLQLALAGSPNFAGVDQARETLRALSDRG